MRFRTLNRIYASLFGYFWLPCPLCGQMSGGHEWRDIDGKPSSIPTGNPGESRASARTALGPGAARPRWSRSPDSGYGRAR